MTKRIEQIIAVFALLSGFSGAYLYIDSTYARAKDTEQLAQRLDRKIAADALYNIQERVWKLEDRYMGRKMPVAVKEEYRQLLEDKKLLEEELKTEKTK